MLDSARDGLDVGVLTAAAAALAPLGAAPESGEGGAHLPPELTATLMLARPEPSLQLGSALPEVPASLTPPFALGHAGTPFGTDAAAGQLAMLGTQPLPLPLPFLDLQYLNNQPANKRQRRDQ